MIRPISGTGRSKHPRILDEMFRARAIRFRDELGWDVTVRHGWEVDRFDVLDPLYLVSMAPDGISRASLRLMPTTGPTFLCDSSDDMFDEPVTIRSANTWEATRFCLHGSVDDAIAIGAEILAATCEVGLDAGLNAIIGVFDPAFVELADQVGWKPQPLAVSRAFVPGSMLVGLWDVSQAALDAIRVRNGFPGSVLETHQVEVP